MAKRIKLKGKTEDLTDIEMLFNCPTYITQAGNLDIYPDLMEDWGYTQEEIAEATHHCTEPLAYIETETNKDGDTIYIWEMSDYGKKFAC